MAGVTLFTRPLTPLLLFCRETEKNWHLDLKEDTQEEVERQYGKVENVVIEKDSPVSCLMIRCSDTRAE